MKIPFDKVYMLLFELDSVAKTKRTYSEKDQCYVVDTEDLKEPLNTLVKIIKAGEEE